MGGDDRGRNASDASGRGGASNVGSAPQATQKAQMACEGASVVEGEQCPNEIDARNADNAKTRIAPRHL